MLSLRPIRPEDEALHLAFLQHLDPEDIRMRVFYSKRTMERSELARLVQIDYAREMAFVALATGPDGQPETLGVVRAIVDPDNVTAEFGVIVRSDLKGSGLGLLLMKKLIAYQHSQGTQRLVATVLKYNERMLKLAKELGFQFDLAQKNEGDTQEIFLPPYLMFIAHWIRYLATKPTMPKASPKKMTNVPNFPAFDSQARWPMMNSI